MCRTRSVALAVASAVLAAGCAELSSRDCVGSWNETAGGRAVTVRDAGYRRATFGTWRDGGSNTGRLQCAATFRVSEGRSWAIFATLGKQDRRWRRQIGGKAYGSDSPTGDAALEATVREDGSVTAD